MSDEQTAAGAEKAPRQRRNSGTETRKRGSVKPVRFDPAELARIEAAADRQGLAFGSFVRAAALAAAEGKGLAALPVRSVRRKPVDKELMARLLGQLGKVGGNLNQIVKMAYGGLDRAGRAEAAEVLIELRAIVPLILEAMGRPQP